MQSYISDNTTEVYDESLFGLPSDYEEEHQQEYTLQEMLQEQTRRAPPANDRVGEPNRLKLEMMSDMTRVIPSQYDGHYSKFENMRISSALSSSRNTDTPETMFTEDYRQSPDSLANRGRHTARRGSRNTDTPETMFTEDYRQTPDSLANRGRHTTRRGSRNTDTPETMFTEDYRQTPDSLANRGRHTAQSAVPSVE